MDKFDFAIGWPEEHVKRELFINALKAECRARKLSFVFIGPRKLKKLINAVKKGRLIVKFYLDMASETYDPADKFTRLAYSLKDAGTRIVADPDDVKEAADKSITHFDLLRAKVPVPYTIVIRNWEPTRRLSHQEKKKLRFPFVIKPAMGYGQKGVKIINKRQTLKEIAKARRFDIGDNFLLQEFVEPLKLAGKPAWFRVYNLFGEVIPCWWNPYTNIFRQVTLKELDEYKLLPLIRISSEIGRITRIDWFSCEIAINKRNRKFLVVDYMNDQCAVYPQSKHKDGLPDDLIVHIAERIIDKAWQYIQGKYTLSYRAIWFPRVKVRDEDA
ncbi:MAG: hypothetical protein JW869_04095 [Candidatus Omnitrophica bacterium]|nr:hypothetical protein [Candidatus Omnitrophota bacterium]